MISWSYLYGFNIKLFTVFSSIQVMENALTAECDNDNN